MSLDTRFGLKTGASPFFFPFHYPQGRSRVLKHEVSRTEREKHRTLIGLEITQELGLGPLTLLGLAHFFDPLFLQILSSLFIHSQSH